MKFEESIQVASPPEKVFSVYSEVSKWPEWDEDVVSASLEGEFQRGATGKLKPKGAPTSKIKLIEVTPNKSFTVECKLPLCKMHFIHELTDSGNGTTVKNVLEFSGFAAPLFGRMMGKGIAKTMPSSLQGLKSYIESK